MADAPEKKKRKKPFSATGRTLVDMRKMGFDGAKVEQKIPYSFISRDFINIIDIIAFKPGVGIIGIQSTAGSGGNHAARRTKAMAEPRLRTWLLSGGRFEIWSYAIQGARDTRKKYVLRREELKLDDLPADPTDGKRILSPETAWRMLRSELAAEKFFASPADVAARMDQMIRVDVMTEIRKLFAPDCGADESF